MEGYKTHDLFSASFTIKEYQCLSFPEKAIFEVRFECLQNLDGYRVDAIKENREE